MSMKLLGITSVGFIVNRSTIDQIFYIQQILEKSGSIRDGASVTYRLQESL
jgi:hypothetical protein